MLRRLDGACASVAPLRVQPLDVSLTRRFRALQLHPNIFWNRYGEWFSLTNVTPTSPDTCLTTFDIFFKPKTLQDTAFVAKCLAAEDQLQKEDIELCMRVGACVRACVRASRAS